MKVTLIEAPICKGSPTDGSQYAYRALLEAGLADRFEDAILSPMTPPPDTGEGKYPNMKYLEEVMTVSRSLQERVANAIRGGRLPIILGGDHSVAMGSIAGASSIYGSEDLAVIYVDGHTDINTEKTTETGFLHGMPLAAAMGLCDDALTVGKKVNLCGKNTYIIGARSIDEGEYPTIRGQGVTLYTADDVRQMGMDAVIGKVLSDISASVIHLSFDVDVLDETVFPATGYQMPNGLGFTDAEKVLAACFATRKVISFDVVEYNPTLDPDGIYRKQLLSLIQQTVQ